MVQPGDPLSKYNRDPNDVFGSRFSDLEKDVGEVKVDVVRLSESIRSTNESVHIITQNVESLRHDSKENFNRLGDLIQKKSTTNWSTIIAAAGLALVISVGIFGLVKAPLDQEISIIKNKLEQVVIKDDLVAYDQINRLNRELMYKDLKIIFLWDQVNGDKNEFEMFNYINNVGGDSIDRWMRNHKP